MKRRLFLVTLLLLLLGGLGALFLLKPEALAPIVGGETAKVREMTRSFLEDVQFKDFARAASYHAPDEQQSVDIPFLLERLFLLKPEQLEIRSYEILLAEVDSTGLRGRSKTRIKAKDLLNEAMRDRELMLYFFREREGSPWFMRLESSLRQLKGSEQKKH